VPEGSPKAEVRIHAALFRSDDPKSAPGGFMNDVNPESETIWPNSMIESGFHEVRQRAPWPEAQGEKIGEVGPESVRFQAMRIAYFVSLFMSSLLLRSATATHSYIISGRRLTRIARTVRLY
jgi:glutaminyl-tRNA synthetase